jgi:hypothetical protein
MNHDAVGQEGTISDDHRYTHCVSKRNGVYDDAHQVITKDHWTILLITSYKIISVLLLFQRLRWIKTRLPSK